MSVLAWHWHNGTLRDGRPVVVGETLVHEGPLVLRESGLHASVRAVDALQYAPGLWISRVECGGETLTQADKIVCRERKVLWTYDAERVLWEWLCWCAEQVLPLFEQVAPNDKRPHAAIALRREWLAGRAVTDEQWAAARDASRAAARARAASRDAAWDAARAASRDAAWDAAWAAAWAASRDAAWDAAWAAAWDAAWDAVWYAARDAQNAELERLLEAGKP